MAGVSAFFYMITKGGLETGLRSLASEYAKEHIRFNAVAPGIVETRLHAEDPKEFLKTLSPMGSISTVEDIASGFAELLATPQPDILLQGVSRWIVV
jgi:NAD(P)-dependent dehydrogenase (short-subunit alcohol dehydrogenase family)